MTIQASTTATSDVKYIQITVRQLSDGALVWLRLLAQQSDRLGAERLVEITHSGMFNLRYYQGIADELGGRKQFLGQV